MFEKKQTGSDPSDDKDKTSIPEQEEAKEERKRGGAHHHARKRGGHIPGSKSASRPDKRARGGGAGSDTHPMSSAGNMSGMDYERGGAPKKDEGGSGPDKNAKGFA